MSTAARLSGTTSDNEAGPKDGGQEAGIERAEGAI
jgi:hypothetical protein